MDKIIKAKIQELCPDVMELKFGCEILNKNIDSIFVLGYLNDQGDCLNGFYKEKNNSTWIWKKYLDESFEILGSPITLAVVLRAISKIVTDIYKAPAAKLDLLYNWNLEKDRWEDQTKETQLLIGSLLGVV